MVIVFSLVCCHCGYKKKTEELVADVHQKRKNSAYKWNASALITVKADKQFKVNYYN